ncbi:MAG: hypothetical protein HEQ39_04545 [Rhizobacter sp.]
MRFLLLSLIVIVLIRPAIGAEIYIKDVNSLHIDGDIRDGDAERVAKLLSQSQRVDIFFVNSLGGDVLEAINIASLVEGAKAQVVVKKGELCASACFFVFIAGTYRFATGFRGEQGEMPSQVERRKGFRFVGIHRPYLSSKSETTANSINKQKRIMENVRGYLSEKAVPQYLIDEMMSRPSNDTYWLRPKDLEMIGDYESGFEEVLIKHCEYSRESWKWSKDRQMIFDACENNLREKEFHPVQDRFIARLRSGWRPWANK